MSTEKINQPALLHAKRNKPDWGISRARATRFVDIFGRCWYTGIGKTATSMSPIRLRRVLGSEAAPRLHILREPLVLHIRYPDRGVSHARAH